MTARRCALAAALVAFVAVGVAGTLGVVLAGRAAGDPPEPRRTTVVERSGDETSTVAIVETRDDAGAARASVARWTALAGIVVVPLAGLAGWRFGPRLLRAGTGPDRERERRRVEEVVHELRTPLAVTAMNLDLVRTQTNGEIVEYVDAARRALERMKRTVADFEAHGGLSFEPPGTRTLDLAAEARSVAQEHAAPAAARGVRIDVDAPRRADVAADRQAVRTVVGNLLDNAVRLAPTGSTITVVVRADGRGARVSVRDQGPGIDPAHHELVFHRHWRGRYETDRGEAGTRGLGLTIARQVAEAQGGHLTLASAPGTGSTFTLWLPPPD